MDNDNDDDDDGVVTAVDCAKQCRYDDDYGDYDDDDDDVDGDILTPRIGLFLSFYAVTLWVPRLTHYPLPNTLSNAWLVC